MKNRLGIHARPSTLIANTASKFLSRIFIVKKEEEGEMRVDARSVLGLMMLTAPQGTQLIIEAEGPDAEEAVEALVDLIEVRRFDEE